MEKKNSFFDTLSNVLGKVSVKLSGNIYINAIKDGMLAYMPFAFIASIFLIIAFFPIPAFTDFITNITGIGTTFQNNSLLKKVIISLYKKALHNCKACFFENEENKKIFL